MVENLSLSSWMAMMNCFYIYDKTATKQFYFDLIQCKVLPASSILVSSCPHASLISVTTSTIYIRLFWTRSTTFHRTGYLLLSKKVPASALRNWSVWGLTRRVSWTCGVRKMHRGLSRLYKQTQLRPPRNSTQQ